MKDSIPAGAGEKMQYIVHPFNDNTIRFILRYPARLQAGKMKQAAYALANSVDVLHASFVTGRLDARWQVHEFSTEQCFFLLETDDDPLALALTQALQPIHASDPVQMRCVLVQGQQECAVVLLISHLCADGSDGKYLLRKLCEAYNLLVRTGSCTGLSIKDGSRAVEQVYTHLSRQDRRRLLKDPRSGIKSVFPFPTDAPGHPMVLRRRIPGDIMAKAHASVKRINATVNDLLLTACYYAYMETAGISAHTPFSIMSMMDLRRHCEGGDSDGLCNLTGALPTALPDGVSSTFKETLEKIAAQTRRCKEDPFAGLYGMPLLHGAANNLPMGLLLSAASRLYGSMSVGMTNIGSIDCSALQMDGICPVEGWFGGPVKKKPGVQISAASFDGACALSIWGYAAEQDEPLLQQLLDRVSSHVEAFSARDE